jgi:hypothetical protein
VSIDPFLQNAQGKYTAQGNSPFSFQVPANGTYFLQVSGATSPGPVKYRLSLQVK